MDKIFFMKDTGSFDTSKLELPGKGIVLYTDFYTPPKVKNAEYILFYKYKNIYDSIKADFFIFVGLNRMIQPSNRCEFIFEYLSNLTPNVLKYSIDTSPFLGEPWRIFWHYLFTHSGKFNVSYSYAIETEWQKWFYREVNHCRLSADNIHLLIDSTYSNLDKLTTTFNYYSLKESELKYYREIKEIVFEKYNSPKLIINNLLKMTNKHFNINVDYDSYLNNVNYNLPDIGIYRFIGEENARRLNIYNMVIT